ncbi:MAG: PEP-CTERM sorting domain-containing protein [Aquabacterium sp.]|nr:MAG: PEP-CTERM sorting domain-containing protein [Aquabacterium sp.]
MNALAAVALAACTPAWALSVSQTTPGEPPVVFNQDGSAQASTRIDQGPGYLKLVAGASTSGQEAATAKAGASVDGAGVLLGRTGGIGEPGIARAYLHLDALLSHTLAPGYLGDTALLPDQCCSYTATLDLHIGVERQDADGSFSDAADYEIDLVDVRTGRPSADGSGTSSTREIQLAQAGDGFAHPGFADAYSAGAPLVFSFLLDQGQAFRISVGLELSVTATATQVPGYECVSMVYPMGPAFPGLCVGWPSTASVVLDAGNSLYWGGLELLDSEGRVVESDFVRSDGFDLSRSYLPAASTVPEPASGVIMLAGMVLGTWTIRRRRG